MIHTVWTNKDLEDLMIGIQAHGGDISDLQDAINDNVPITEFMHALFTAFQKINHNNLFDDLLRDINAYTVSDDIHNVLKEIE